MKIRLSSTQVVVTVAAVALPLPLHLAGHKHHHAARNPPAQSRTTHAKQGSGTTKQGSHTTTHPSGTGHRQGPAARTHRRHHHFRVPLAVKAHSARDPGVAIADFSFSPGSLTIHAGDTVTWSNNGPAAHTATASNGSFNTGTLAKGASASHTFSTAGTFSYFCTIHPFMHGTIVVLASATTSTPSTTPGTTTTPTATTASGGLPNTGLDLAATVLCGVLLGAVGLLLRRPARGLPQSDSGESRTRNR